MIMNKQLALGSVSVGLVLVLALSPGLGCYETSVPACTVSCVTDADCPGDLSCNGGKCSTGEACTVSCTPNEFQRCSDASTAERCNGDGTGLATEACGAGCNETRRECNVCVPDQVSCASPMLQKCNADGSARLVVSTCRYGCVEATGGAAARCAHIAPAWTPNACDVPATNDNLTVTAGKTINTSNTNNECTGGIVEQPGFPMELCVIRYRAITIEGAGFLSINGPRIPVLIADEAFVIDGRLDVSANFTTDGPGVLGASGGAPIGPHGGGGAGFEGAGGAGGDGDGGSGGGGLDGAPFQFPSPPESTPLRGGFQGGSTMPNSIDAEGGGGGGAVVIASCRGTVAVNGIIDASGGGGTAGRDSNPTTGVVSLIGGGGGGSGGYIVFQGRIELTSNARIFASGGGGGGGSSVDNAAGFPGQDGSPFVMPCAGGGDGAAAGAGGAGGCTVDVAQRGADAALGGGGGGGGSVGRLQIFAPITHAPVLAGSTSSPFAPLATVPTR